MLTGESISFAYRKDRPVLRGVDIEVVPGRVTALVGPNGSGKSTLLRVLAGLRCPTAGAAMLAGRTVSAWTPAERAGRLAYVAQRPAVAFGFTVLDVTRFGQVATGRGRSGVAERALNRVGVLDRAGEPFGHLSVGQQQRVALARTSAQLDGGAGPAVLLADEPVSAMDPRHAVESLQLIRALVSTDAVTPRPVGGLVVLHDLSMAARYADDAVLLDGSGRVAHAGPVDEVLEPGRLEAVFGIGFSRTASSGGPPAILPLDPT